ncbi:RDD family protein [Streptomyces sp. TLI_171]|uniref:RDD family protein n=1 Tax=Streptomyces sp. TLI_171 TaxID=1938859 RepID=UPI000C18850A|nr:RDD family protein [Streptomyces sp. TLI_171]RKE19265.1 putative RDD family membrane protein YckC [Streptomyces sp. TLI_171]
MTDRPSTAGPMHGAPVAGDAGAPGYYPDPSVPGFVRFWAGHAWVPGTSRPAPAAGEHLEPPRFVARYLSPPPYSVPPGLVPAAPAAPLVDTGPVYLDETGAQTAFTMSEPPEYPVFPAPGEGLPGELEIRPRTEMAPLRPVDQTPWAVAGNGLQPVTAESWATAAALRPGLPEGALVVPRNGSGAGSANGGGRGEWREVEAAARPLELPAPAPAPAHAAEEAAPPTPRVAQPLDGTPWHGADGGSPWHGADGGTVGLAAGPGALYEPVAGPAEPPADSGWRADPRAQRGLMETGGAPRWVSWGVEPPAAAAPVTEAVGTAETPDAPSASEPTVSAPSASEPTVSAPAGKRPGRDPRAAHVAAERVRPPRPEPEPESASVPASASKEGSRTASSPESESRGGPGEQRRARPGAAARGERAGARSGTRARRAAAPASVPAGVGARALAWLVDGAVWAVVGAAVAVPLAGAVVTHVQRKIDQAALVARLTGRQHQVWLLDGVVLGRLGVLLGVLVVFGLLYQVLPIARTGQTFGKRLARIRVVAADGARPPGFGRSLLRWLVRGLGTVLLLGPAVALLDRSARRAWHDRVARTRVVRAERG